MKDFPCECYDCKFNKDNSCKKDPYPRMDYIKRQFKVYVECTDYTEVEEKRDLLEGSR